MIKNSLVSLISLNLIWVRPNYDERLKQFANNKTQRLILT